MRFVGEPAVDDGGPRREFLTLSLRALRDSPLLIGNIDQKVFNYSTQANVNRAFFQAGKLVAISLLQGGPSPSYLSKATAHYLIHGMEGLTVSIDEVPFSQIKEK